MEHQVQIESQYQINTTAQIYITLNILDIFMEKSNIRTYK